MDQLPKFIIENEDLNELQPKFSNLPLHVFFDKPYRVELSEKT